MTANGKRATWRLVVQLPDGYAEEAPALFAWLRDFVIPACLNAPVRVSVSFEPPDDRPDP